MRSTISRAAFLVLALVLWLSAGCSREPQRRQSEASTAAATGAPSGAAPGSPASGSVTAAPNPIRVCDVSGLGVTALSWRSTGVKEVQVHVGSPDGALFASTEAAPDAPKETGKWVTDGMVFYLQNTTDGLPLTSANTLSTVTVKVTKEGCP